MSRPLLGGLLLAAGLLSLWLFTFVVKLPSGLDFLAIFFFGVTPAVLGAAIVWTILRGSKRGNAQADRLERIKDQIVWRAVAEGGRITAADAVAHVGLPQLEVEHALMILVSEGRAVAEPGEAGEITYRIDSPV